MRRQQRSILISVVIALFLAAALNLSPQKPARDGAPAPKPKQASTHQVRVLSVTEEALTPEQIARMAESAHLPVGEPRGAKRLLINYTSSDPQNKEFSAWTRLYLPDGVRAAPLLVFAPGTTGVADTCAASLEVPAQVNRGNYEGQAAGYVGAGYAVLAPDYEGMRDPNRLHHYMIGELEGRAVLDAVRATRLIPAAGEASGSVFLSGFSQGGHAALWADQLAPSYAPEVRVAGVLSFAGVADVEQTWRDITRGATINWFGRYVLRSYHDYYQTGTAGVLLPALEASLVSDTDAACIETAIHGWSQDPQTTYTPEFLSALSQNRLKESGYAKLEEALDRNRPGEVATPTPKILLQGEQDTVVLAGQQPPLLARLCRGGPARLNLYPGVTHSNVISRSFADTLAWMGRIRAGEKAPSGCPS